MMYRSPRSRRIQRISLLAAAFAFLLQALAWSAMPVYAGQADEGWVAICTSEGIKWIPLSQSGMAPAVPAPDDSAPALADHCDLCVFALGLGIVPAPASLAANVDKALGLHPPAFLHAFSSRMHVLQQPRAPPVSRFT